jgi:Raf kinase inhibitor-like YbhB/YbcL family protein
MKIWSDSWINGERIPPRCAAGRRDDTQGVCFSDNRNPHLGWDEVPDGTQSFAVIAHDFDVPSRAEDVNRADREVPEDLPRVDFFHWVLADLPSSLRELGEGDFSQGFTPHGKPGPSTLFGARHGLNDFTGWFRDDAQRAGRYFGYDGPLPPYNDSLVHHYVFTLYALDVARAPVADPFDGHELRRAIYPHVLAEATLSGTYSLNPRLQR